MVPATPTRKWHSFRFVVALTQLVGRCVRSHPKAAAYAAASQISPSEKIDLGDLGVAQLVHDLRNELTIMMGCVDALAFLVPRGEADRQIAELRWCGQRASLLTRELLLGARPRSPSRRPVDLNDAVASAAETLSRVMRDSVRLRLHLSSEPALVEAESIELERILLNLALNARDAMDGHGVLTIETAVVGDPSRTLIDGALPGPYTWLTVTDTGAGLTNEMRERMFEPFFTTKKTATGLGLSSVAFTVRQLGGTIHVKSRRGRGTSVSVILPLASGQHHGES
jgi:two-component system, cell cycle sensor histidine kinase and response regulator CckA